MIKDWAVRGPDYYAPLQRDILCRYRKLFRLLQIDLDLILCLQPAACFYRLSIDPNRAFFDQLLKPGPGLVRENRPQIFIQTLIHSFFLCLQPYLPHVRPFFLLSSR